MSLALDKARSHISTKVKDELRDAMPDEAFSWAEYEAYAREARRTGQPELAQVMNVIAHVEKDARFYHEALLSGLINKENKVNLQTAVDMAKNHVQVFQKYEQQATSENCLEIASYFRQLVQAHQNYVHLFQQTKQNLESGQSVPTGPQPQVIEVRRSAPACGGKMHKELKDTEKHLAMAWGTFSLFAHKAVSTAHPQLAALFQKIADAEMCDHFNNAANLSGLVQSNVENLKKSIHDETMAHDTYTKDLPDVRHDHDPMAADFVQAAKQDKKHHKNCFEYYLNKLTGQGGS